MNRSWVLVLVMVCAVATAWSQTGIIEGRVIDARTLEPLPFANIFINNTTFGVASDADGVFKLRDVPPGTHEVVFSFVGYESYQAKYAVREGEATRVNVKLLESDWVLDEVAIRESRDKTWEKQLRKFERIFLGDDDFGRMCKITNPWVIDFKTDNQKKFTAKAHAPVEIVNEAIGYKLAFHLKDFSTDGDTYSIVGTARFEEVQSPDANVVLRWTNNRKTAYIRSTQFFFKSLIDQRLEADGFRLYKDADAATPMRSTSFATELVKNVKEFTPGGIIGSGNSVYELQVQLKQRVEVHYINEPTRSFFYKDVGHSVSWLEARAGIVRVTREGVVINSKELIISGDMGVGRVSEMLPLNYKPGKAAVIKPVGAQFQVARYQEKAYLHLNKPYYYPGETIWARAYVAYRDPGKRDTLSNVLYIDLLNPSLEVIQSRMLRLDSLPFADFRLPASQAPGLYSIRAYSNWMLNFGESSVFTLGVPVLDLYEKLANVAEPTQYPSKYVELQTDKPQYNTRELVQVTLNVTDEEGNPTIADLSASVVDIQQVGHVSWSKSIAEALSFSDLAGVPAGKLPFNVERGFILRGQFLNDRQKPVKGDLTFVKGNFDRVYSSTADANGHFQVPDLDFYDSATFAVQVRNRNVNGVVKLVPRPFPLSGFRSSDYKYDTEKQQMIQRVLSVYELPDDATMLQEVSVTASRIQIEKPVLNVYGQAEKVFQHETLAGKGGSLGTVLQGMMPGYTLAYMKDHWYFIRDRSALSSGKQFGAAPSASGPEPGTAPPDYARTVQVAPGEPVLVIDDALFVNGLGETVGDRLQTINPSNVQTVEVNSMAGSYTGSLGVSGAIVITMKRGGINEETASKFQSFNVKGFELPSTFRSPDYSSANDDHARRDFRSTIYWNPSLITDSAGAVQFSFYTSDLPGTYLINIEGLSITGTPLNLQHRVTVVGR